MNNKTHVALAATLSFFFLLGGCVGITCFRNSPQRESERQQIYMIAVGDVFTYRKVTGQDPGLGWLMTSKEHGRLPKETDEQWVTRTDMIGRLWEFEHVHARFTEPLH